jgi:hypothetical protein
MADDRFIRDGRTLGEWLRDLVSEDTEARQRAGEAITAMLWGVPSVHTDLEDVELPEHESHQAAVRAAVKAAVAAPDFPTVEFVRALQRYMYDSVDDWLRQLQEETERFSRVLDETLAAIEADRSPENVARQRQRFRQEACRDEEDAGPELEAYDFSGSAMGFVFGALDEELLCDPDGLRRMLDHGSLRRQAIDALVRLGPRAAGFKDWLLERFRTGVQGYEAAEALAAVARDDAEIVRELVEAVTSPNAQIAAAACSTLEHVGLVALEHSPELIDVLLAASCRQDDDVRRDAIGALASIGRDREDVLRRVVEAAESPSCHDRMAAWYGLRHFTRYPEQAVAALIAALERCDQPDLEWEYGDPSDVLLPSLQAFGPAAAPAVPFLAEHLMAERGEAAWDFVEFLGSLGPAASAALAPLRELRRSLLQQGWAEEELADISRAIAAIAGKPGHG